MITHKRLSELADRCVCHIVAGRTKKALIIAQYLREATGGHFVKHLDHTTGYSRVWELRRTNG